MFVNRQKELKILNDEYKIKKRSSFTVIYGRRRIGKTALIQEYIKDKPVIFYYATETNYEIQLVQFTKMILEFLGKKYLENLKFSSFEQLFIFLSENLDKQKRTVLVIDEYQQLTIKDKSFSSVLQKMWDLYLKDKNIHLILCGSVISMMHSEVLDYSSPLYGRRTSNLHLKELKFNHIKDFIVKRKEKIDKIEEMNIFSSFGTVPKYLEIYEEEKGFYENIVDNILNKNSYLYQEVKFLLKEEIKDLSTYFSILEAISLGNSKIGNIAKTIMVNTTFLSRYLMKLVDLNIIEKEVPITEKNPLKSKLSRYRIKDKFINFWFYYVYRNLSYLEIENTKYVIEEMKRTFNEKFVSFAFEDYVKELVMGNPDKYFNYSPIKIGRWWNNKEEIDLVAYDKNNITFIECKWQNQKVGYNVIENLIRKTEFVLNNKEDKRNINYIIFSKSGFKSSFTENEKVKLVTY